MAYRTLNPFTEQLVETIRNTPTTPSRPPSKADGLFHSDWSKGDIQPRLAVLKSLSGLLTENRDDLARTMAEEMGKPLEVLQWC